MLDKRVLVMGVLNVTPDSFFDGGQYASVQKAVEQALIMQEAGADIIDVGGESTRPGAPFVSIGDEIKRVVPVIDAIRACSDIKISVDTSKAEVMRQAVSAGANIINDVRSLKGEGALGAAVELGVPVCLMHMQGEPVVMQNKPQYESVVDEVLNDLMSQVKRCESAGMKKEQLWIDPGFGFGKNLRHNLSLLKHLTRFADTGFPVLAGMSRKSMLGEILDVPVEGRLAGSLALASLAVMNGASIIRAHDVKETVHIVKVCEAVLSAE
ncbi:MAG: dihydropteroate synthase [Gammaproteobacteria bacterium]|nr:dihydropteroate synthase [Gammaproteobacteria bacterium]